MSYWLIEHHSATNIDEIIQRAWGCMSSICVHCCGAKKKPWSYINNLVRQAFVMLGIQMRRRHSMCYRGFAVSPGCLVKVPLCTRPTLLYSSGIIHGHTDADKQKCVCVHYSAMRSHTFTAPQDCRWSAPLPQLENLLVIAWQMLAEPNNAFGLPVFLNYHERKFRSLIWNSLALLN